ncbi:MAG: DNA-binding protein [Caldisericota bacterium]|nr:DNA-binding protein [Caldisericota bacterium]
MPFAQDMLETASLDLPADPDAPEFSAALQLLRGQYTDRTAYNFMVADQLAKRSVSPNGLNVRLAGKWGNANAVTADVRAWYAGLAKRLSANHAKVPEAVQRGANTLLEQMWTLVTTAVQEPALQQINALQAELSAATEKLASANQRMEVLTEEFEVAKAEGARVAEDLQTQLQSSTAHVVDLASQVNQLRESISQAAIEHQQELRAQAARYEEQMLAERRAHQDEVRAAAADLAAANGRINQERDRLDAAAREHALAIDRYRQDVKEANQRAEAAAVATRQAGEQIDALKDQIATGAIREARAQQDFATERAALEARAVEKDHALKLAAIEHERVLGRVKELEAALQAASSTVKDNSKGEG